MGKSLEYNLKKVKEKLFERMLQVPQVQGTDRRNTTDELVPQITAPYGLMPGTFVVHMSVNFEPWYAIFGS